MGPHQPCRSSSGPRSADRPEHVAGPDRRRSRRARSRRRGPAVATSAEWSSCPRASPRCTASSGAGSAWGCCRSSTPTTSCSSGSTGTWPIGSRGRCRPGACTSASRSRSQCGANWPRRPACAPDASCRSCPSPPRGAWSTTAHLFLAHELSPHAAAADSTEELEVRTVPFGDAPAMVLSGEIVDAMTIIAILWADRAAHP